ncbi:hypothetical protein [Agrobacterium larrymoorei]|uniref:Uncharacterized protein n=1 Tax=Agrobacterium larrymoorei TaxID=160699 RepID=A0AAF0H8F7_9HYPH|nr:hypothetical protein [Agrobacterium larrymoorei]WHA39804.1 hypothetical protein CFBP5477_008035 [Agrobacterium larrymoorei]
MSLAVGKNAGAIGVRCKAGKTEIMYVIMNTGMKEDDVEKANDLGMMKLKLRIDKSEVKEFGIISSVDDGKYIVLAEVDKAVAEEVRDAKRTVAVAVSLAGKNFWENSFQAKGSTEVVGKVLSLCNDTAPAE